MVFDDYGLIAHIIKMRQNGFSNTSKHMIRKPSSQHSSLSYPHSSTIENPNKIQPTSSHAPFQRLLPIQFSDPMLKLPHQLSYKGSEILVIVVIMVKSSKYVVIIMLKYNYNQSEISWYLLMSFRPWSNLPRHSRYKQDSELSLKSLIRSTFLLSASPPYYSS